jgi:hypothetical protein
MSALFDSRYNALCQERPEHNDPMPLSFRTPLIIGVSPRVLCGEKEHGELQTVVAFRLTLLRISTDESHEGHRIQVRHF